MDEYIVLKQGDVTYNDKFTKKQFSRLDTRLAYMFLVAVIVLGVIAYSTIRISYTLSGSMVPTLSVGEVSLMRAVMSPSDLHRGDIVIFDPKTDENADNIDFVDPDGVPFVKRLIGLPGERIRIEDDVVYINDEPLDEPYAVYPNNRLAPEESRYMDEITIPEGHYFFMGDNRDNSYDSRFGVKTIPYENIQVKMVFHFPTLAARFFGTTNNQYFINGQNAAL